GTLNLTGSGNYFYYGYLWNSWGGAGTTALNVNLASGGMQSLVGAQITYTGPTVVNSGTLQLYSTSAFNSPTTVNSGATLGLYGGNSTNTSASMTLHGGTINDIA